ncbi:MAG: TraB/GumN family protein [Termitinemataceae bacterium]|nr:MAG: TraB/GumN family protein [Termitinemataceae bacterium]
MNDNRIDLNLGDKEIILIGTAHISKESIAEVQNAIEDEKPDVLCVELDEGRYNSLIKKDAWEKLDIVKVFKEGRGFFLIANLVLGSFQRRLGSQIGVKPGEEMKCAVEKATELSIPFTFCDRDIQVTLRRAWARCGFFSKGKLLAALLSSAFTSEKLEESQIEDLKKSSELDGMMSELSDYLPEVKEVLIDERDRYLAAKIWDSYNGERKKSVAVVGAGHLHGLRDHLKKIAAKEEDSDVTQISFIPKKNISGKIAGWIIPVIIVALIIAGFLRAGSELSIDMLLHWVLWNGSLAAAGTILALGHPLTIPVAFIGAPIGTLNPFLSVGIFTGIVQAILVKPQVTDAENISDSISSIKGLYKNRITHALLVFFLSSLGGALGNLISIPNIVGLLFR